MCRFYLLLVMLFAASCFSGCTKSPPEKHNQLGDAPNPTKAGVTDQLGGINRDGIPDAIRKSLTTGPHSFPLKQGFRWTYERNNHDALFIETMQDRRIRDVDTYRIRATGDSLFWTDDLYVKLENDQLFQYASGHDDDLFLYEPARILFKLPLRSGQIWHSRSENKASDSSFKFSATVMERQNISVPAGDFQAWKIEYVLGWHFGTEHDIRVWFSPSVGIVKLVKWRRSTLGKKSQLEEPIVYELSRIESLASAHSIDYPSAPQSVAELPKNVVASGGKLTLYADFADRWQGHVVLYVVNRSGKSVNIPAQDNDYYVKLEALNDKGVWERAQSHQRSWCGNSYRSVTLQPGHFISLLGWLPKNEGSKRQIRYRFYSKVDIASNSSTGLVSDNQIKAARQDDLSK